MSFRPTWIFRSSRAYRRLQQNFDTTRAAVEAKKTVQSPPAWIAEVEPLLAKAEAHLKVGDLDGAWHFLHAASSKEIPYLRGQELWDREQMLGCEAKKINSKWRQCAIAKLLTEDPTRQGEEDRAMRLRDATGVLLEHFDTQYYKAGMLRDHMRNLLLISLTALVAFLALLGLTGAPISKWPEWDWKTLLAVLLFGVLGASFSATRKVSGESAASKIPEVSAQFTVTVARTVLGAIPALAGYALIQAKLIQVVNQDTVTVLAFAFIAGFSERFVLKVLESGDAAQQEKNP